MTDQLKEARERIKDLIDLSRWHRIDSVYVDHAQAFLASIDTGGEVCPECGGGRKVYWDHMDEATGDHVPASAPCPECTKEQETCLGCWWAEGGRCYVEPVERRPDGRSIKKAEKRCGDFQGKRETLERVIPRDRLVITSETLTKEQDDEAMEASLSKTEEVSSE